MLMSKHACPQSKLFLTLNSNMVANIDKIQNLGA